jgi:peptidoglycan/xylan/chitin deacetylase (PgdA/CDA1 family)
MPFIRKPKVQFILSVDTEEEWDWSGSFPYKDFSINNVFEIPAFQLYCEELGIKPTYLVDHAMSNNIESAAILKELPRKHCEIGAHLHPWVNPPFTEKTTEFLSHVINLPIDIVEAKLVELISNIQTNIGVKPTSFRTGRWGINGAVIELLAKYGFEVDSSIYPLYHNNYFSCEAAPTGHYKPNLENTNIDDSNQTHDILEIPVSCGFNRSNYSLSQKMHKTFEKRPFSWLKINGVLWHTLLLRKIYLSPELCTSKDMNRLIDNKLKNGDTCFHMYLHSSSLLDNVTGLNNELNARESICQRIGEVIHYLSLVADIEFLSLTEAKSKLTTLENV